jgi:transcriptional regulator with XRE-family HTH domain
MNFADIGKIHGLSQEELAFLFGISVEEIKGLEQGPPKHISEAITLDMYMFLKNKLQTLKSAMVRANFQEKCFNREVNRALEQLTVKALKARNPRRYIKTSLFRENLRRTMKQFGLEAVAVIHH